MTTTEETSKVLVDALANQEGVKEEKAKVDAPLRQSSSVDPVYVEPHTPHVLRGFIPVCGSDADALKALCEVLVQRIECLETALRPLANQAPQVGNARMCLVAAGRGDEPAAGIWVSGVQNIHMVPNESIFFNACDAYGRKRVEEFMAAAFERVRKAQEAANEKGVHIENGGKLS